MFGQLSQLTHFDPTPSAIAAERAPRVYSWVNRMEDLASIEVADDGWLPRGRIGEILNPLLCEIGRVYAPFLIANARALSCEAAEVRTEIDGRAWVQQPFPYQGKCLKWLREAYAALSETIGTSSTRRSLEPAAKSSSPPAFEPLYLGASSISK